MIAYINILHIPAATIMITIPSQNIQKAIQSYLLILDNQYYVL